MNNFTNNRWLSVITLLLLTANMVTLVILWTYKKGERGEVRLAPPLQGQVYEFVSHELKLDTVQQKTYKKLREEHRADMMPLQDSIGRAKDNFFALLQKNNAADSLIQQFSKKIGELEQQRDVLTFRHFQKLRILCSKEQQNKFDNIIREVLHRMITQKRQGPPPPGMRPGGEGPLPPAPGN